MKRRGNTSSKCTNCGKNIMVFPYELKKEKKMFCGQKCQHKWLGLSMQGENHPAWQGGDLMMKCPQCLKSFMMPRSHRLYGKNHFCSHRCADKYRGEHMRRENHPNWKHKIAICIYCKNTFSRVAHQMNKSKNIEGRFCSSECHSKWKSEYNTGENNPQWKHKKINCTKCGKEIIRAPYRIHKLNFCSNECASIFRVGPLHPHWQKITVTCSICGKEILLPPYLTKIENIGSRNHNGYYYCSRKCQGIAVKMIKRFGLKPGDISIELMKEYDIALEKEKLANKRIDEIDKKVRDRGQHYKMGKTCSECGKPIIDKNEGGKCSSCHTKEWNKSRAIDPLLKTEKDKANKEKHHQETIVYMHHWHRQLGKKCIKCASEITDENKSGLCKPCMYIERKVQGTRIPVVNRFLS